MLIIIYEKKKARIEFLCIHWQCIELNSKKKLNRVLKIFPQKNEHN